MALHKVFGGEFDFRIPDYQRPYAWEPDQADQLLQDLAEALERGTEEPYFLGSVVLVKAKGSVDAMVIDGQQRLTTLTIVLAVLRDLTVDAVLRGALEDMVLEKGNPILGRPAKPRLTLRAKDAEFFRKHVQNAGSIAGLLDLKPDSCGTDAQKSIVANTRSLHTTLAAWSPERRQALMTMIGSRTFLVVVSTPTLDSAHRIFSVMNARGLDLSPADIFKADVIGGLNADYAAK
ncbi:MAG: DUF262 domain-containing protein [Umezawaea sp.]